MGQLTGFLKAIILALGLIGFGFLAFVCSVLAFVFNPVFPGLRFYSNSFFLVPFGIFARAVVGIRLTHLHRDRIEIARPAVLIGNHQTGLDLAIISTACTDRTVIVGKKEIGRIPFFGWFFWMAGNLMINRSDKASAKGQIDAIRETLDRNHLNLAIFPEGTRSKTGAILPFKRGAFYLAVSTGYPLIPVVCSNLKGKGLWESFELKGGNVVISVLPPIETKGLKLSDLAQFSEAVRQSMVEEYARVTALANQFDQG